MSRISMQNISVMSVQYWHYSFEYFLDSMERCQLKNIELWAGAPHYCFDDFPSRREARERIIAMRATCGRFYPKNRNSGETP